MKNGKAWTMQLLAVACFSLAAKMEEIDVPLSLDLQVRETHLHALLSSFLCLIFLDFSVLDDLIVLKIWVFNQTGGGVKICI